MNKAEVLTIDDETQMRVAPVTNMKLKRIES